ncbi:late competence protein ComER [Sutcliffiella rhizosphaerae]|uniref:Pyrroline-5-carboxylate reductase n=1 Tax=Sutcliffiella rhizosphaerae TaxID=2880967 RepID=A0ABM8YHT4_9BACI|nr:late competence protein ComER [Sutcliffiella rhizosphaerae]CAG9619387.1 Pyrroline-5-carboxylate reductase [Sutcliffiella rhizosphaerae]
MKIGMIGTGNMGKILVESFIDSKAVPPEDITITNRSLMKAYHIKEKYKEIHVEETADEVVTASDIIFLCVKPLDIHPLLTKISQHLTNNKCIISITSPVSVGQLQTMISCQVARIIPSITNRALSGVTLLTFGSNVCEEYKEYLIKICSNISTPIHIEENVTRVASDIVSCGPAFFSYILQRFIDGAVNETAISKEQATELASQMIIGMGKLIEKDIYTLQTLQEKVCVKGGVTGEGIKVLENELGDVFNQLIQKTHEKFEEDLTYVKRQFQ